MNIFSIIVSLDAIILILTISGCITTDTEPEPVPDIIENEDNENAEQDVFTISASTFDNNEEIPSRYTCGGDNINPEIITENLPDNTESLVLIVDDPDAPI